MRKSTRIVKKSLALFLVVLMGINTFAAVVGDNDGAAFITKAEFDSLKNSFQSQIDTYNSSIDNKINGAIAAYLAGIVIAKTKNIDLDSTNSWSFPVWINDGSNKWNDYTSTFYECSNPEIHTYQTKLWYDGTQGDNTGWKKTDAQWDKTYEVTKSTNTVSREGWSWMTNNIPGEAGLLSEVVKTSDRRVLGSENLTVFELKAIGHGYKLIYWIADTPITESYNGGSYADKGNFEYGSILGQGEKVAHKYITTPEEIKPNQIRAVMVAGFGRNGTNNTLPTGNNRTTKYLTDNNVRSWANTGGGTRTYLNISQMCVSANDVWTDYKRNWCYINNANMAAETANEFCYTPYLPTTTTIYRYLSIQNTGWNYSHSHTTTGNYTAGAFASYAPTVVPYFNANRNTDWLTNNYFSYLPAKQVRYETKDGDVHFMDEGFYMLKVDEAGDLKFDILFKASDSSSTTTDVSLAKAPFNNQFSNTNLLNAKVGSGTEKTVNQVATNTKVTIEIKDLEKNTPIYMKWTNASTTDTKQIGLYSLDNIKLTTGG